MMQEKGDAKTLQTGSNGFTCLVDPEGTPLCADAKRMEWRKAVGAKKDPPDKTGFIYMMAGDTGTSNHDPYATDKSHWVQTGPHVMIVGTAAREMAGIYPRTMDPDPSQAYVMFPGTPYEHLMLPVHPQQDCCEIAREMCRRASDRRHGGPSAQTAPLIPTASSRRLLQHPAIAPDH